MPIRSYEGTVVKIDVGGQYIFSGDIDSDSGEHLGSQTRALADPVYDSAGTVVRGRLVGISPAQIGWNDSGMSVEATLAGTDVTADYGVWLKIYYPDMPWFQLYQRTGDYTYKLPTAPSAQDLNLPGTTVVDVELYWIDPAGDGTLYLLDKLPAALILLGPDE